MKLSLLGIILISSLMFIKCGFAATIKGLEIGSTNGIQGPAWNGKYAQNLTINSTTLDFSKDTAYSVYTPSDCWERWMPAINSVKANYIKTIIVGGSWQTGIINNKTPFGNFSGCTSGYLKRHNYLP